VQRQWSGQLRGIQFNYQTPYTMSGNFTLQYELTPTLSAQAAYVTSLARHLEVFPNSNNPTAISAHQHGTAHKHCREPNGTPSAPAPGLLPKVGFPFLISAMAAVTPSRTATVTTMGSRLRWKSVLRRG
jgi:hypothetical protein